MTIPKKNTFKIYAFIVFTVLVSFYNNCGADFDNPEITNFEKMKKNPDFLNQKSINFSQLNPLDIETGDAKIMSLKMCLDSVDFISLENSEDSKTVYFNRLVSLLEDGSFEGGEEIIFKQDLGDMKLKEVRLNLTEFCNSETSNIEYSAFEVAFDLNGNDIIDENDKILTLTDDSRIVFSGDFDFNSQDVNFTLNFGDIALKIFEQMEQLNIGSLASLLKTNEGEFEVDENDENQEMSSSSSSTTSASTSSTTSVITTTSSSSSSTTTSTTSSSSSSTTSATTSSTTSVITTTSSSSSSTTSAQIGWALTLGAPNCGDGASINPFGPYPRTYRDGEIAKFEITPAPGYIFVSWTGADSPTPALNQATMDSDKTVIANCIEE
jgi:hypothetical protein